MSSKWRKSTLISEDSDDEVDLSRSGSGGSSSRRADSPSIFSEDEDSLPGSPKASRKYVTVNAKPEKSNDASVENDVIELSDDDSDGPSPSDKGKNKPHPANLSFERQRELVNTKKVLEMELLKEKAALQNLKTTSQKVKIEALPDRGAKLRSSLEEQVLKVKGLSEQLSYVASNIVDLPPSQPQTSPTKKAWEMHNLVDLTKDHANLSEMGKRALATHQAHQSQAVNTLERLHQFLKESEGEKETGDPEDLKVCLLPHQRAALSWLLSREASVPPGGILADDMGLGKTLTMISLILKDMECSSSSTRDSSEDEDEPSSRRDLLVKGKTLVVCPSSVIGQWAAEVKSKVKYGKLSVYTHHGQSRETRPYNLSRYDIVLTTYTILQLDNKEAPGPLLRVKWNRVVLDEAHVIRNHRSKTAEAVFSVKAKKRWALTGTPIHNKQEDYFSLLKFLKCKPFDDLVVWKKMIGNRGQSGVQRLHLLTKSLLLRRTKEEIQQKGGLKSLKPKQFFNISVKLDPEEAKIYHKISLFSRALLAQYITQRAEKENLLSEGLDVKRSGPSNPFPNHPELGKLYDKMIHMKGSIKTHQMLVLLLRLRQICIHPSLITSFVDQEVLHIEGVDDNDGNDLALIDQMMNLSINPNSNSEDDQIILSSDDPVFKVNRCSSKIRAVINCVNEILSKGNDKLIVVSQWKSVLDIIKSFLKVKSVALDGKVPVKDRIGIIEEFNKPGVGAQVMLLSLTAGGTGLNLVGANHLLLVDVHWNPQLEAQACDRIYRVGQLKTVCIYKFVTLDTIEERIVKLQNDKLEIAKGVLTGSSTIESTKLTLNDLKALFDVKM